jgi:hypothetical protein
MQLFVFVILFPVVLVIGNRTAYLWARNSGGFCSEHRDAELVSVIKEERRDGFRTDALCWPTGLRMEKGRKYRLTLETPGDWFDKSYRADVMGFPSSRNWIFFLFKPFRRWWSADWFIPIARVGAKGSEEFALVPSAAADRFPMPTLTRKHQVWLNASRLKESPSMRPSATGWRKR